MKIIIITRPDFFEGETSLVNALFRQGMPRLHLRKPKATEKEMAEWIDQIDRPFRHRIVLHDHYELARTYGLGGIHLNSRNPEAPDWALLLQSQGDFTISKSCHSIEEITDNRSSQTANRSSITDNRSSLTANRFNYLTLSPIFDSISKEGYGAAFSREELAQTREAGLLDEHVYALGGISLEHLSEVHEMGFSGAAILGDLWLSESPLDQLQKILVQASVLG